MSSHAESPSSLWSVEARQLASDALEMLELRRELAELEIRHGTRVGKRLAIAGGAGAVLIITSLPLLLTSLAHGLSTWTRLSPANWILILGGFSLLLGAGIGWAAYQRFRSDFTGLKSTLAELNEDMVWLREWTETQQAPRRSATS
jgi:uncharacterized membrane protein YqjE